MPNTLKEVLTDESLAIFLGKMRKFNEKFCDNMVAGDEFTLRMEIHGAKGELIHARVQDDSFGRPAGAPKKKRMRLHET